MLKHDEYPSIKAFVVFNRIEERNKCLHSYHKLHNYICCAPEWPKTMKLLKLHKLVVKPCSEEPSNIKWENQDV